MVDSPDKTGPGGDDYVLDKPVVIDVDPADEADPNAATGQFDPPVEDSDADAAPSPPAPAPAADFMTNVIPEPRETWIHKFLKNPFQHGKQATHFPYVLVNRVAGGQGIAQAHLWFPPGLFSRTFVRPVIMHIDHQVRDAGVIQPLFDLDAALIKFRHQREVTSDPRTIAKIEEDIEKTVKEFSRTHGDKFVILAESLKPVYRELQAAKSYAVDEHGKIKPNAKLVAAGKGVAGLTDDANLALIESVTHISRLCEAAKDPDTFYSEYNKGRKLFTEEAKKSEDVAITGGMQLYTKLALETDLRVTASDHAAKVRSGEFAKEVRANPSRFAKGAVTKEGFLARLVNWGMQKLGFDPNPYYVWKPSILGLIKGFRDGKSRDAFRTSLEDLPPRTYMRDVKGGADGMLEHDEWSQWDRKIEKIESHERGIRFGYFNEHIRTDTVFPGKSQRENAERFGISISRFHKMRSINGEYPGEKKLEEDLMSLVNRNFDAGHDFDGVESIDRLNSEQGAGPNKVPETIPGKFGDHIAKQVRDPNISNFRRKYYERVQKLAEVAGHSPDKFHQRYLERVVKLATDNLYNARIAPSKQIFGTPGFNNYVIGTRDRILNPLIAYVLHRDLVEQEDLEGYDGGAPKLAPKNPPPEPPADLKGIGKFRFHALQKIKQVALLPWNIFMIAARTVSLPFVGLLKIPALVWNHAVKPGYRHMWPGIVMAPISFVLNTAKNIALLPYRIIVNPNKIEEGIGKFNNHIRKDVGLSGLGIGTAIGVATIGTTFAGVWTAGKMVEWPLQKAASWAVGSDVDIKLNPATRTLGTLPFLADQSIGRGVRAIGWKSFDIDPDWLTESLWEVTPKSGTVTDTKDPATPGGSDAPAQPALTPDKMLADYVAAVGLDFDADGTPGTAPDAKLKDRFMQLMQTRPDDLKAIAAETDALKRNVRIHDLFLDIAQGDFDGAPDAAGTPVNARDGAISNHWKRQTGIPMPIIQAQPSVTTPAAPATSDPNAAKPARLFEFRVATNADYNGDGAKNGLDLEMALILDDALEILADPTVNFGKPADANGDGAVNGADIEILLKLAEIRKTIQGLNGGSAGDLNFDGKIDEADVARAREIIANYKNMKDEAAKKSSKTVDNQGVQPNGPT